MLGVFTRGRLPIIMKVSGDSDKMSSSNAHSKDLLLKNIVSAFAHDSLRWMGIEHTDVIGVMPTEFATVEIRNDLMDYVFTLADDTLLHLEFQSSVEKKLHRFLLYDTLLAQKTDQKIRTVVLYENQVKSAPNTLDIGSAQYHVENIYLAHKDAETALARIRDHVTTGTFTLEDRFDLAFALHMRRSRSLEELIHQSIELIEQIPDHHERSYVAAIFVELSTRWLDDEKKQQIRKWVERMDIVKEIVDEAVEKAVEKSKHEERVEFARKLLAEGESPDRVVRLTGLSPAEVKKLSPEQ